MVVMYMLLGAGLSTQQEGKGLRAGKGAGLQQLKRREKELRA